MGKKERFAFYLTPEKKAILSGGTGRTGAEA